MSTLLLLIGLLAAADPPEKTSETSATANSAWGPGEGFEVFKKDYGSLSISPYILVRYINQLPAQQSFVDHLGREQPIDTRNDIQAPHRVLLFVFGHVFDPAFTYRVLLWTVNASDKVAIIGDLTYEFDKRLVLSVGTGGVPGSRSLLGSHPFWLGTDRVMADEFFRPGFSLGAWLTGEVLPTFFYKAMIANNISQININAREDTRNFAVGGSLWWQPTTGEFGPRGGFGDFEDHERVATRFGACFTHSREDRFTQTVSVSPENQQIKLADSLNLFDTGSLAPDVTVQRATYRMAAADVGMKYRGFFLQAEGYLRWLDEFATDGPLPIDRIFDKGFYVQTSYMVWPEYLELYVATSFVFGDKDAGFRTSRELVEGINWYPFRTRYSRINAQVIEVSRSAASSLFGYYQGGLRGPILSVSWNVLF